MNVEMDFVSDWQDIMIDDMTTDGLQFSSTMPKDSLVIRYFTYLRKKGGQTPRPRRVHRSNEFVCPPELLTGLNQLVDLLENGQDISPYLSKQIDNISAIDGMFNDWGVLHLHLGDRPDARDGRFIVRTGPLLFLYLMKDDAYLINVHEHGDWADKSILQTVQDNWPDLIKPYVLKGVIGLSHQYTEEQHADFRNAGVAVILELKDVNGDTLVIAPPGLGITTSRDAMQDVRTYQGQVKELRKIEDYVLENDCLFQETFNGNTPDPLCLKLVHEDEKWSVIEQSTGARFQLS
ncbi:hypothetical protein ACQCT5_02465 [Sutcliffiella halmapala]